MLYLAERVGFEPTVRLHVRLISSQNTLIYGHFLVTPFDYGKLAWHKGLGLRITTGSHVYATACR